MNMQLDVSRSMQERPDWQGKGRGGKVLAMLNVTAFFPKSKRRIIDTNICRFLMEISQFMDSRVQIDRSLIHNS